MKSDRIDGCGLQTLTGRWGRTFGGVAIAAFLAVAPASAHPAAQVQRPSPALPAAQDPAFERRVMAVAEELRCLVCQNQTIADSNAELAVDLKRQIREQLASGRTDRQVVDFMVERYGDFVLYRPPLKSTTVVLWYGPLLFGAIAVATVVVLVRRRRGAGASASLSESERRQAAELLGAANDPMERAR